MSFVEYSSIVTGLLALAATFVSYLNNRQIKQIHVSINSRMDQLLSLTADSSHAKGIEDARLRGENADKPKD
jgi:hypothetical protein